MGGIRPVHSVLQMEFLSIKTVRNNVWCDLAQEELSQALFSKAVKAGPHLRSSQKVGSHLTLREFLESWRTPAVSQASSTESSSPPLRQPRGEARAHLETAPRESQYFRVNPDPTSQKWVLEVPKGDGSQLIPLKLCPTVYRTACQSTEMTASDGVSLRGC